MDKDASARLMVETARSLGPRWAELVSNDPEAGKLLGRGEGRLIEREQLQSVVREVVLAASDERSLVAALSRLRQRHLLRIAYGEVAGGYDLRQVQSQLTDLADALVEAALALALRKGQDGQRDARCAVIALGPLGAGEASYDHPCELPFLYEVVAADAAMLAAQGRFERGAKPLVPVLDC